MILEIFPSSPDSRKIQKVADILNNGGIIVYPTDTVYSFGCSIRNKKAIEKLARLKDLKLKKANFSIVFFDLSQLSEYTRHISRPVYKILNKNLPGPFTFIVNASPQIPKLFDSNRKTIGIRIPENKIATELVFALGHPLVTTSVHDDDEILEYSTDPEIIAGKYERIVDVVINGGVGNNIASTVVDLSGDEIQIIRQGAGSLIL